MKILAVDDDPVILDLLTELVTSFGNHEVTTADSPFKALRLLDEDIVFDCVLLDIQMPLMDGVELCRRIRGREGYLQTPILMITAMSEKRFIDAAFTAGATDYFSKPFEISELRARIGLVEGLVRERRRTAEMMAAAVRSGSGPRRRITPLTETFPIKEVAGVIEYHALENYIVRLPRNTLFGSYVFALTIRHAEDHYVSLSTDDFENMIVDVSEAISEGLQTGHQYLMAYAGNGTYLCVTEGGTQPDLARLVKEIQHTIRSMDLRSSGDAPIEVRLSPGKSIRLIWRSGQNAISALTEARKSSEDQANDVEHDLDNFWSGERIA